jgi:hypothetical protein
LRRVIFEPNLRILVRGLGLADREPHDDSCIVILLEEIPLREERSEPQRQAREPSQRPGGAAILGSAQPGSAHGVFDVCRFGAL